MKANTLPTMMEKTASVYLLVAWLSSGALLVQAQNASPTAAPAAEARSMAMVLNLERPTDRDMLLLWNGNTLTGTVLNETFSLRTSYAQLEFQTPRIAGIDFEKPMRDFESVITVNSNRFSGFIDEPWFDFALQTGERIKVRREKVRKAVFRRRDTELQGLPQRQFIALKNGDFFTGRVLHDQLVIAAGNTKIPFNLKDAESIAFADGENPQTRVLLGNGDVLLGALELEDIAIDLDVGSGIKVYRDRISSIYCREGYIPDAFRPAAAQSLIGQGALPGAAPNSSLSDFHEMVRIPAGQFILGSPLDEPDRDLDEGPQTKVTIPRDYWIAKHEVTQAQYKAVMGINPSHFIGDSLRPVEKVSWQEAMDYCAKLTQVAHDAGKLPEDCVYRLPTEAEWEYACRAGTTTRFSFGDDPLYSMLADYAWFTGNSNSSTHPVGTKRPNPWGLYDVHGNVWEWCLDRWQSAYPGGSITNQPGLPEGSLRVARGGSWLYDGKICRSTNRDDYSKANRCSDVGFRVVLAPIEP